MESKVGMQRNLRILVIDDQETIHQDYRKIIGAKQTGGTGELQSLTSDLFGDDPLPLDQDTPAFEIDSAFQGNEGYKMVQAALEQGRPYAMAFVDIRMPPGWDGIETVQRIWEIDPEILIVLCSAYSDYTWETMVNKLGRTDRFLILKKPFENIEVRQFAMALTERWNLARTDALTGAMNRRALREQLQREWARSLRHEMPLACVMVDLDFFKRINDEVGHQAGDLALQSVAKILLKTCRVTDLLFRYGGEEFCILMPHTNLQGAAAWAEKARNLVASSPIENGKTFLRITASFGIAERRHDMRSAEALLESADAALRSAKRLGRNRVEGMLPLTEECENDSELERQRAGLLQGTLAKNVMTTPVAALRESTTVGAAARYFLDSGFNSAPIVDETGNLTGIVTEVDVLGVILLPNAWNWPISKIAQADAVRYDEQTPVAQIFDFLSRVTMRRVIIVADDRPVGSISRTDLLRWFSNWVYTQSGSPACDEDRAITPLPANAQQSANSLAARAKSFCDELSQREDWPPLGDDLYGPLVGEVSAMQTLLQDILAFFATPPKTATPLAPLATSSAPTFTSSAATIR